MRSTHSCSGHTVERMGNPLGNFYWANPQSSKPVYRLGLLGHSRSSPEGLSRLRDRFYFVVSRSAGVHFGHTGRKDLWALGDLTARV
jgi:hypothetical protein